MTATVTAPDVVFAWTWPSINSQLLEVALERSRDGVSWSRFSPLMGEATTSYTYTPLPGFWQYRITVMTPAGRIAYGEPVTPA